MPRKNAIVFVIILIVFAFCCWAILPVQGERFGRKGLRLGLDLVGGVHLVYQAQFSDNATAEDKAAAMDRALLTIQKRIDAYGVTEPVIQKLGDDRIMVQLPGFTDIDAAKELVEKTGFLEFREVELNDEGEPVYLSDYLDSSVSGFFNKAEAGTRYFVDSGEEDSSGYGQAVAFLKKVDDGLEFTDADGNPLDRATLKQYADSPAWITARGDDGTPLTGSLLANAAAEIRQEAVTTVPVVAIEWNDQGAEIFDQIAKRLHDPLGDQGPYALEHVLGIFLDNNRISAPKVNAAEFDGEGIIEGNFTTESAQELANLLKSGALPLQLKKPPLYQEKISATLGAEFVSMAWQAGLIGLLLIMVFMIVYYRLPGLLASLALLFYGALVLTIFKLWPVTLSLAGLGGFIASLGMAVDANVLIFERMKEEFRTGRSLGAAIEAGFNRAWSAIRDSNITTIIACIILIWLGSSVMASATVMGFAITLLIGVLVSMLTAITVTRTFLRLFIGTSLAGKTWLFTVGGGKK